MGQFQGLSQYTARKEFEIEGITSMRLNQFKNCFFKFPRILCADVFCGTGVNEVGNEIIDGSPIKLLNGYFKANNGKLNREVHFWFSDVRQKACEALGLLINESNYNLNLNNIYIKPQSAKEAINKLGNALNTHKDVYLILVLDPNGPKDFPKWEVIDLIKAFHGRIDIVPYISATSIKRCVSARKKANIDFKGWLGEIENFDEGFIDSLTDKKRQGWIREPIKGDQQQWTMLPTFGCMPPKSNWKKQGYVDLESTEGEQVVKFYCGEQ